jgi:hypothetical protein
VGTIVEWQLKYAKHVKIKTFLVIPTYVFNVCVHAGFQVPTNSHVSALLARTPQIHDFPS